MASVAKEVQEQSRAQQVDCGGAAEGSGGGTQNGVDGLERPQQNGRSRVWW